MYKIINKYGYFVSVFVLILLSFFQFSPLYSNRYNSDNAVHVLMSYRFQFPADLYYWGQDRLGSLIPMVSSIPVKLFGCSPVWSVSVVQYMFLFFGFLLFASFLKNYILRIILCVIWFFPLAMFEYHTQIGQPYSGQLFFLGLSLFSLHKFDPKSVSRRFNSFKLFGSCLSFMLAIWVSDLTTFIFPFYLFLIWTKFVHVEKSEIRTVIFYDKRLLLKFLLPVLGGIILGYIFIKFAKANAGSVTKGYEILFSSIPKIQTGFTKVFEQIGKACTFKVSNVLISWHTIVTFLLLIVFLINFVKNKFTISHNGDLKRFLLFSLMFTFIIVICSHWVELNGYDTRYFSFTYILLFIFIFICIDSITNKLLRTLAFVFISLSAISGAINSLIVAQFKYEAPKNFSVKEIDEISNELGKCALIGDYWSSYNLSSVQPQKIIATTYDYYATRDFRIIPAIMREKRIFLVGNSWLDSFPPFRNEFGYFLQKCGEPFELKGLNLCQYKWVPNADVAITKFNYFETVVKQIDRGVMKMDSTNRIANLLVCGPLLNLAPGNYTLTCKVGTTNFVRTLDTLFVDINVDQGKRFYYRQTIPIKKNEKLQKDVEMSFQMDSLRRNIELRVFMRGSSQVYVKNIKILKK